MFIGHVTDMSPAVKTRGYTVIVVGAGISGLAATKTLIEGGVKDILLLEGQERPGGRICSVQTEKSVDNSWLELGAQWLHGQNSQLHHIASTNNLLSHVTSEEGLGDYLQENGEEIVPKLVAEVSDVVAGILEDCEDFWSERKREVPDSIGSYLNERFQDYLNNCNDSPSVRKIKTRLFNWHVRFQIIDNSCNNLSELSAKSWGRYEFCGGTDYINFKAGYSSLVDCIVNELPNGVLKLQTPVCNIAYSSSNSVVSNECNGHNHVINGANASAHAHFPVVVTCDDGTEYHCQHVIVTSSIGYLKKHHRTMFKPVLPPELYQSIEGIGFAVINKIFLCYDRPWWTKDQHGFQIIWSSESDCNGENHGSNDLSGITLQPEQIWMKDLTGFDVLANVEGVLLGWVGSTGAEDVEQLTETEIGEHCTYLLRQFTGQNVPLPREVVRSCWKSNRFVCGGYSHLTNNCDRCDINTIGKEIVENNVDATPENLSIPVCVQTPYSSKHPAVLIAGEATHSKYYSTTHGAFETGVFQANRILNYMMNGDLRDDEHKVLCDIK